MAADEGKGKEKFIVGGYEFLSENDAQKASMDLSKINLLEARVKASRPVDIKAVYEKSIENKIFKTPIGWEYLVGLRHKLLESGYKEEDLIPIPLNVSMTRHSAMDSLNVKQRILPQEPKKEANFKTIFSIILNIVLLILIGVMFYITVTAETDNIINYRKNITNRYAGWEQELSDREKAVREAEKRLGIEGTKGYDEDTGTN
ncbi:MULTISPECIES: hypothetical protein [unclassified Butyrivibrio]|uniref:hypothetical protein n=1 Tax=unclassified Butyrivibrio TaxID=2639466 RepID=UPI0003B62DD8|nr:MULTISPECIES: hypothetical protein [unclassified Butyrivibrio]